MRFFSYFFFFLLLSCKPIHTKEITKNTEKKEYLEPHLVFYFLKATNNDTIYQVELTDTKLVKGKLKGIFKDSIPLEKLVNTNWLVSFQDSSNNTIIQQQIKNPLVENIEYINEENNLARKVVYHNKKIFVIRIPYEKSINSVKFDTLAKEFQKINTLFISKINLE